MPRLLRPETITLPLVLCCAGLSAQEDRKRPGVRKEILELVRKGRVERAITRLDDWLHANPKDLSLHRVRLDLLEGKEAWHAAAIRGRRLLALLSDDLEKQALLVRLARFETKAKRPQSFASRLELVRVHRDRGEPAQCLSLLRELHEESPGDLAVLFLLGELHGSDWAAFDAEKAASYFKSFVDTWDRARGTSATADFVESLFEQAPASSPKARALRHLAVLSSGRRLPKPDTTARRQGKRISSEFQNLFEQLRHSRQQRRPREMKSVLEKLRRLQPEHPLIAYSFAEVYASRGPTFDKRRAISYYERFLRLTTDEQLEEGREVKPRFSKNDLVALLQLYATDGSPDQHQGIRDDTRVAITSLEGGKPLYFVSPAVTIGRDERKIDRRIAKADKDIKTIEAKIAKFERELAAWRVWHKAGRKNATASISQLKRDIQRNRRKLSALNEKRPELQARLDWIRSFRKR